jgi:hypothetical protein
LWLDFINFSLRRRKRGERRISAKHYLDGGQYASPKRLYPQA